MSLLGPECRCEDPIIRCDDRGCHCDLCGGYERNLWRILAEVMLNAADEPSEIEHVYGLLWGVTTEDRRVHEARKLALSMITKEGQRRGIEWATQRLGPPDSGYSAVRRGL